MKKYLYSGALALAAILTLSACAKPKLDAKLSVNDIVYMSGSDLKLKDDEITKGKMDDVFLAVTGKTLVGGAEK